MIWKNFKQEKPFDYRAEDHGTMEVDPDVCHIIYRYKNRHEGKYFISTYPTAYKDGEFKGFGMNSPHPEDHIEVLYWCEAKELMNLILKQSIENIKLGEVINSWSESVKKEV
jgi:hypothetical protein